MGLSSPQHPLRPALAAAFARIRARAGREDGQGGIEYFGVVIAAALIVIAIVAAASGIGGDIVDEIQDKVQEIIDSGGDSEEEA
jgi:hypothetical protein